MASAANRSTTTFSADLRWPVYTVFPAAGCFFYVGYFIFWPSLSRRIVMDRISRACFHANIGSCCHSYAVVLMLIITLATDGDLSAPENRIRQYYNPIGYAAMCVTLGYFSLSLPWNLRMLLVEKRKDVVPPAMLVHHVLVVVGALIYVIGGVCAFYGAIGFACMELTNLFFVPRVLAEFTAWPAMDGPACTINGVLLVLTFVVFRVGVCTAMAGLFTYDLTLLDSPHAAEWALILMAYVIFLGVLVLSWIWLRRVLQELRAGIRVLLHQRKALKAQQKAAQLKMKALEGPRPLPPAAAPPNSIGKSSPLEALPQKPTLPEPPALQVVPSPLEPSPPSQPEERARGGKVQLSPLQHPTVAAASCSSVASTSRSTGTQRPGSSARVAPL